MRTHRKTIRALHILTICLRDGPFRIEDATIRRWIIICCDEGLHRVEVLARWLESARGASAFRSHATLAARCLSLDLSDPPMLIVLGRVLPGIDVWVCLLLGAAILRAVHDVSGTAIEPKLLSLRHEKAALRILLSWASLRIGVCDSFI